VEGRIVELEREVVAALLGALRPPRAYFSSVHVYPVARGVVAGAVGLRHDPDAFRLKIQGRDFTLELAADLLERTAISHVTLLFAVPEPATSGLDGDRKARDDRRRTRLRAVAQRRMAAGDFFASRGMGAAQGKKVYPTPLRLRRSRRSRSLARSAIKE